MRNEVPSRVSVPQRWRRLSFRLSLFFNTENILAARDTNRLLGEFHAKLRDRPLSPDDPFYVPYLTGPGDPIAHLAQQIEWRDAAGIYLLSGHPGCGKSTELRRLKNVLEERECSVFLIDMLGYMNMSTPVEVTDFFLSLVGAIAEAVGRKYERDLLVEGYFTRFKNFLHTRVTVDEIGLEAGFSSVTASLKNDPTFRQAVQERLRGHLTALLREAHDFIAGVVDSIRRWEEDVDRKVVLLVDSLEKIRGVGAGATAVHDSVRNLFYTHADSLRLPLHVIYTLPPYLIPLAPGMGAQLGTGFYTIPSLHVFHKEARDPDPEGIEIMRTILDKRFASWNEVFSGEQVQRLAVSSGGDLREYLYLLSFCLIEAGANRRALPLGNDVIEAAENFVRRSMLPISDIDKEWLRRIAQTHEANFPSIEDLPSLARLFDTKLVLNYRNGNDWYDVHPLLRTVIDQPNGT